ncbi:hypothetical protein PoB_007431400 [Plakobranchus ocellatus]|uniref:Uncharacterized protein n=1 Tax=Plakobranchus ocellatus TaxID=259542 RepID=A0AAV4DUH4_9GAST|nr:hypothetical protein PoB_007431400 [Plakobranchus ocellatus]
MDLPAYHRPYYPTFPLHHNNGSTRPPANGSRAGPKMVMLSDHEGGDYSSPASFLYPQLYPLHPSPYPRSSNAEPSFAASHDVSKTDDSSTNKACKLFTEQSTDASIL